MKNIKDGTIDEWIEFMTEAKKKYGGHSQVWGEFRLQSHGQSYVDGVTTHTLFLQKLKEVWN